MINFPKYFVSLMTSIALSLTLIPVTLAQNKLNLSEINSIAKQTTVIIAPQLTQQYLDDLLDNKNKPSNIDAGSDFRQWGAGSGVLIAKQGNTYYVLTVAHNFLYDRIKANHPHGIVTSDRTVHVINNINDGKGCPDNWRELVSQKSDSPLMRFGCYVRKGDLKGIDLAIISFESDKNYPVAPLGKVEEIRPNETIYVSGWPKLEEAPKLNQDGSPVLDRENRVVCQGMTPRRTRRLAWGPLKDIIPFSEKKSGNSLFYVDNTQQGMSGSPVFDGYGRVIGVHSTGSQSKPKCGEVYQGRLSPNPVKKTLETEDKGKNVGFGDFESDDEFSDVNFDEFESDDEFSEANFDEFESDDEFSEANFDEFESDDEFSDVNFDEFESNDEFSDVNFDEFESDDEFSEANFDEFESDDEFSEANFSEFESDDGFSNNKPTLNNNNDKEWSKAQNVDHSRQLLDQANINLPFNLNYPSPELINKALIPIDPKNIQGGVNTSGRADLGSGKGEGALDDPNDVIEDIYKLFSFDIKTMIRDKPSGGCGSVLLDKGCQ